MWPQVTRYTSPLRLVRARRPCSRVGWNKQRSWKWLHGRERENGPGEFVIGWEKLGHCSFQGLEAGAL